jgi:ABC-type phosphate/phosphonate transport system substrate-binding protein
VEGAKDIKSVWKSDKLPSMPIVAFPSASSAEKKGFQGIFSKVCEGDGKDVCKEVGLSAMKSASSTDYQTVITAYAKQ